MIETRVISIGAIAAHPLWNERAAVRTGHATTTLIRTKDATIVVDPGLPPAMVMARLGERAAITPEKVTHVFLTSFRPDVRRGIEAFGDARWMIHEPERETVGANLVELIKNAKDNNDDELVEMLAHDVAVLKRCEPAPDTIAHHVDLFPLPGVTPGLCGLLVAGPSDTTLVCGDAIPTIEHLEQGKVLPSAVDIAAAKESLMEAVEIADLLVLGRDNIVKTPGRQSF